VTCCFNSNCYFHLCTDGMTASAGQTPIFGLGNRRMNPSESNRFETRVIGVEVICGPVNTHFIYSTDELHSHGANIMIEIQRLGNN